MKVHVPKDGLLIPNELLEGADEVEISKEPGRIIILPIPAQNDPIFNLGKNPVKCHTPDGAEKHDEYLYRQK